jgi:hypothetical protein
MKHGERKIKGISLDEISISVTGEGIIISTGTGYHLTIFIDQESKFLNAHLTQEIIGSPKKVYLASVTLDLIGLEEYSSWLFQTFYSMLSKVKIQILNRKGYALFYDEKKRLDRLMIQNIKRHATVKRKKVRPNLEEVRDLFSNFVNVEEMVHDPKILYDSRTKKDRPIWASVVYKKKKAPLLQIFYLPIKGFEGWYHLDTQESMRFMEKEMMSTLTSAYGDFGRLVDEKMKITEIIEGLSKKYADKKAVD